MPAVHCQPASGLHRRSAFPTSTKDSFVLYLSHLQNNLTDYYYSDLTFYARFLSHFTLFFILLYSGPEAILCESATLNIYFCNTITTNNNNRCMTLRQDLSLFKSII